MNFTINDNFYREKKYDDNVKKIAVFGLKGDEDSYLTYIVISPIEAGKNEEAYEAYLIDEEDEDAEFVDYKLEFLTNSGLFSEDENLMGDGYFVRSGGDHLYAIALEFGKIIVAGDGIEDAFEYIADWASEEAPGYYLSYDDARKEYDEDYINDFFIPVEYGYLTLGVNHYKMAPELTAVQLNA